MTPYRNPAPIVRAEEPKPVPFFAIPALRDFWEIGLLGQVFLTISLALHFAWGWVPCWVFCLFLWIMGVFHRAQKRRIHERSQRLIDELHAYRSLEEVPKPLLLKVKRVLDGKDPEKTS